MFKAAIIGSGFIGDTHASVYKKIDDVELIAIADINEDAGKKAAEKHGALFYIDAEEMLKDALLSLLMKPSSVNGVISMIVW